MTPRREQPSRRQGTFLLAAGLLLLVGGPVAWWSTAPEPAGQTVTSVNADAAVALAEHRRFVRCLGGRNIRSVRVGSRPVPGVGRVVVGGDRTGSGSGVRHRPGHRRRPAVGSTGRSGAGSGRAGPDLHSGPRGRHVGGFRGGRGDGELEIPADVHTVGWYRFGALPGTAGIGRAHRPCGQRRPGAGRVRRLGDLDPGQQFAIVDETGTQSGSPWSLANSGRREKCRWIGCSTRVASRGSCCSPAAARSTRPCEGTETTSRSPRLPVG